MPSPATSNQGSGQTQSPGARNQSAVVPTIPFVRASGEHREGAFHDSGPKILLTTGPQDMGTIDVPAYGYLRNIVLEISGTGATGGAPAVAEDFPFSVLQGVSLSEPNGAVIAQFNSGYDLFLANKYGGYRDSIGTDTRSAPGFVTDANGNFTAVIRLPVEISARDALGALPNQTPNASFKLKYSLASGATAGPFFTTAPTTQPTVRVKAYIEAWDQPAIEVAGASNQLTPPAMNTTQFWLPQTYNVSAGFQTIRLSRVGQYMRNLVFIFKRAGTSRANGQSDWPDPVTLYLDARPIDLITQQQWDQQVFERYGFGGRAAAGVLTAAVAKEVAGGLDNGVRIYDFTHEFDQSAGRETRDLWLPTLGSTRLELQGTWANAGVLTVLTNDVAIAGPVFI